MSKLLVLVFAVFILLGCELFERDSSEGYEIFVEVEDVFCTEAILKVTLPDSGKIARFLLERAEGMKIDSAAIIDTFTCFDNDTLISDNNLLPDRDYTYRVSFLKSGKIRAESEPLTIHTMDTTSHDITYWDIDTLGISGQINDVWIVDEDDIWVVGEINVPDPDSSWNGTGRETFNAAHWNGEKWEYIHIRGNLMNDVGPLNSIWYFDENNIWVAGFPIHWDGNKWTLYHLQDMGLDVSVDYIWASSPDDIYFVGYKGSIVHYDGKEFEKMESGTDVDLQGIYGLDKNHIWVAGTMINQSRSVILFYNGVKWNVIVDTNDDRFYGYGFNSIWTDSYNYLFLNGGSGRCILTLYNLNLFKYSSAGLWYGHDIDGTGNNDIFCSGAGSEIVHYNGISWHVYEELKMSFGDWSVMRSIEVKNNLIVSGGYYYTGLYGLPIVIRGHR